MFKIRNGGGGRDPWEKVMEPVLQHTGNTGGCLLVDSKSEPNSPKPVAKASLMGIPSCK